MVNIYLYTCPLQGTIFTYTFKKGESYKNALSALRYLWSNISYLLSSKAYCWENHLFKVSYNTFLNYRGEYYLHTMDHNPHWFPFQWPKTHILITMSYNYTYKGEYLSLGRSWWSPECLLVCSVPLSDGSCSWGVPLPPTPPPSPWDEVFLMEVNLLDGKEREGGCHTESVCNNNDDDGGAW